MELLLDYSIRVNIPIPYSLFPLKSVQASRTTNALNCGCGYAPGLNVLVWCDGDSASSAGPDIAFRNPEICTADRVSVRRVASC